jgi:Uma2 family endonuclease
MTALILNLRPTIELTDDQFYQICQNNPELRLERTAQGKLIVMPPTGGGSGKRNFSLTGQLAAWVERTGLGEGFDSSTVFRLPNGANRSPDASWIANERWNALTLEEQEKFPPIAPDFVVELRSRTDSLEELEEKMQEYMENGVRLGWLLDPQNEQAKIYRQGQIVEVLRSPATLSGEEVLPGFVLDLSRVFR